MSDMQSQESVPLKLRHAVGIYLIALVIMLVCVPIVGKLGLPTWIIAVVYLAIGIALSHLILKRLIEWHPMYNTLGNVSRAKLTTMLAWPISYLILFIQLAIHKVL